MQAARKSDLAREGRVCAPRNAPKSPRFLRAAHSSAWVRRDPGGEVRGEPDSGRTDAGWRRGTRSGDELGGRAVGVAGIVPASGPALGSRSLTPSGTALRCLRGSWRIETQFS